MSTQLRSLVWFSNCTRQLRWLRSRIARLDVLDAVAKAVSVHVSWRDGEIMFTLKCRVKTARYDVHRVRQTALVASIRVLLHHSRADSDRIRNRAPRDRALASTG